MAWFTFTQTFNTYLVHHWGMRPAQIKAVEQDIGRLTHDLHLDVLVEKGLENFLETGLHIAADLHPATKALAVLVHALYQILLKHRPQTESNATKTVRSPQEALPALSETLSSCFTSAMPEKEFQQARDQLLQKVTKHARTARTS